MPDVTAPDLDVFYDTSPLAARMVGGPHDGESVFVPGRADNPPGSYVWRVEPEIDWLHTPGAWPVHQPLVVDCYRFSGHVADDGARLYSYWGRS